MRRAPRWLATPLVGWAGFVLGALLVALLVALTSQPSSGATGATGTPTVHLGISNFAQSTVTISKGSTLLLIDDGQFPHILQNRAWMNNTPHPAKEQGAPSVQQVHVNGNSIEIGPFTFA